MKNNGVILMFGGAFLLAGVFSCAHQAAVSPEQLSASEAPVRAATEAGADKIPASALYLKLAREEIESGKAMGAKGDKRGSLMFARARVDAELALALAQDKSSGEEAQKAFDKVKDAGVD